MVNQIFTRWYKKPPTVIIAQEVRSISLRQINLTILANAKVINHFRTYPNYGPIFAHLAKAHFLIPFARNDWYHLAALVRHYVYFGVLNIVIHRCEHLVDLLGEAGGRRALRARLRRCVLGMFRILA